MNMILTAKKKPFKLEQSALKAIKDKPDYVVIEHEGGFVGVMKTAAHEVVCPGCGGSFHDVTNVYDPEKFANPAMINLKSKYRGWGWDELPQDSSMGYGCLVCPECGTALAPSGKLRVR